MTNVDTLKRLQPSSWFENKRLPLMGGILLGHLGLIGLLLLLPNQSEHFQEAKPAPMVMVELQPPVPLSAGDTSATSQQAVTATSTSANLNDVEEDEGANEEIPTLTKNPPKAVALANPTKPVSQPAMSAPSTSTTAPAKVAASSTTTSETAITSTQASSAGSISHEEGASKGGPAIASTAPTTGSTSSGASSPQFGAGYLRNPAPEYPELARSMGEEGKVLLHVLVTSGGLAKKVKLHHTSGSDSLDNAAIKAVKKWRFVPAKLGDQAVEAWVYVPIVFKLD